MSILPMLFDANKNRNLQTLEDIRKEANRKWNAATKEAEKYASIADECNSLYKRLEADEICEADFYNKLQSIYLTLKQ